ncbi:hypothetical protein DFQ28_009421 [Apophysomyces sp. BC1034]|nr:hypothetical protein DFQ28_009421 [Apophysomyces sp. BC1034]
MDDNPLTHPLDPGSPALAGETLNLDGRTVATGNGMRWIGDAWAMLKRRPLHWAGLGLLYMVIEFALSFVPALNLLSMFLSRRYGWADGCSHASSSAPMAMCASAACSCCATGWPALSMRRC